MKRHKLKENDMTEQELSLAGDAGPELCKEEALPTAKASMSKFVVRLPPEILEQLKRVSRHHNRSMNTEINLLLGRYLEQLNGESRPGADEHMKLNAQLLHKLSGLSPQKIDALLDLLD